MPIFSNSTILIVFISVFANSAEGQSKKLKDIKDVAEYYSATAFTDEMYENFDWRKFYKYEAANEKINLKRVDLHLLNAAVFYATNKTRETQKKRILKFSTELRDAAMTHSWQMITRNFFNHENRKSKAFRTVLDRATHFGFDPQSLSENIEKGFVKINELKTYIEIAEETVAHFLGSPRHKEILLKKRHEMLGCGSYFYPSSKNGHHWFTITQDFGTEFPMGQ